MRQKQLSFLIIVLISFFGLLFASELLKAVVNPSSVVASYVYKYCIKQSHRAALAQNYNSSLYWLEKSIIVYSADKNSQSTNLVKQPFSGQKDSVPAWLISGIEKGWKNISLSQLTDEPSQNLGMWLSDLSQSAWENGNHEMAMQLISTAIDIAPEWSTYYVAKARYLAILGKTQEADKELQQCQSRTNRRECNDMSTFIRYIDSVILAKQAFLNSDLDLAFSQLSRALVIGFKNNHSDEQGQFEAIYTSKGLVINGDKNSFPQVDWDNLMLGINDRILAKTSYQLGLYLMSLHSSRAEQYFLFSVVIEPDWSPLHIELANYYSEIGKSAAAKTTLDNCVINYSAREYCVEYKRQADTHGKYFPVGYLAQDIYDHLK